jgi:hypothetical protein
MKTPIVVTITVLFVVLIAIVVWKKDLLQQPSDNQPQWVPQEQIIVPPENELEPELVPEEPIEVEPEPEQPSRRPLFPNLRPQPAQGGCCPSQSYQIIQPCVPVYRCF